MLNVEQLRKLLGEFRAMHEAGAGGSDREMIKEWADAYCFSREDLADLIFMMLDDTNIVVEVTRECCMRNSRLGDARVVEGPAYVKAHSEPGPLGPLCAWLAERGHTFVVKEINKEVSVLEWARR